MGEWQMVNIKVRLLSTDAVLPTRGTEESASVDLYQPTEIKILGNSTALIGLGIAVEIPKGYMLMLVPRSSTGWKTPLIVPNSVGIIDSDYRGEIKALFKNTSMKPYTIQKHSRLMQAIAVPIATRSVIEVNELGSTERGHNGFGSTGK